MIFQIAILAPLLLGLIHYKGAAGITRIQQARATGALHLAALPSGGDAANRTSLSSAEAYLRIVWPALVFGILITVALRTSLSRIPLHRIFIGGTAHDQCVLQLALIPRTENIVSMRWESGWKAGAPQQLLKARVGA